MYQMSVEERADREKVKALHQEIRNCAPVGNRYRNLAWGFIRGFKFHRIERSHHFQSLVGDWDIYAKYNYCYQKVDGEWRFYHNFPSMDHLFSILEDHVQGLKLEDIKAWFWDPTGAIPVPAPRPKRTREEHQTVAACSG